MKRIEFINDTEPALEAEVLNELQDNIEEAINEINSGSGGGDNTPIGSISLWFGAIAPDGYLICDGKEYSKNQYLKLYGTLGVDYQVNSEIFKVPDFRDKVPVGLNINTSYFNSLGKTGGEATHTLTVNEMPSHSHGLEDSYSDGSAQSGSAAVSAGARQKSGYGDTRYIKATGGSQAHNNLQPYIVCNYIIKAVERTPIKAQVEDSLDSNSTTNAPSIHAVNETLKGTTIYESSTGTLDNIDLNQSISNYSKLLIECKHSANVFYDTFEVVNPEIGKQIGLQMTINNNSTNNTSIASKTIQLADKKITRLANRYGLVNIAPGATTFNTEDYIVITKVIGYK